MANGRLLRRSGFGVIEILVALACLSVALIPILNLFSLSIDSARLIHARSTMYTGAQELLSRCQLVAPEALPTGVFQIPGGPVTAAGLPSFLEGVTVMPEPISRTLTVTQPDPQDPQGKKVAITVRHAESPQLDITWTRSYLRDRGGRF